jgi:ubiquinone/menaquinone biosynthesis C-methylase UbiE
MGVLHMHSYAVECSESEVHRLVADPSLLDPITIALLRRAGIRRGMRVLDLGCGAGDVSLLAAEAVGPSGSVVGVDREGVALEIAEARRADLELDHVSFHAASLDTLHLDGGFDAAIGRCVLSRLPWPAAVLRDVVRLVRPGGVIAFHEVSVTQRALVRILAAAGLPHPQVSCESPVDTSPDSPLSTWISETVGALLPRLVALGITTQPEIDIETLGHRLRRNAMDAVHQFVGPVHFCAWTRTPLRSTLTLRRTRDAQYAG